MEEVAKAECVSPGGGGLEPRPASRGRPPHTGATPSGTPPPTPPGTHLAMPTPLGTTSIMGLLTQAPRPRGSPTAPRASHPRVPLRPRRPAGRCSLVSAGEAAVRRGCGGLQVSGRLERARGWGLGGRPAPPAPICRCVVGPQAVGAGRAADAAAAAAGRRGAAAALPGAGEPLGPAPRPCAPGLGRRPAPPALHAGPAAPVACARTTARLAHHAGRGRPHPSLPSGFWAPDWGCVDGGRRGCDGKGEGKGLGRGGEKPGDAGQGCLVSSGQQAPHPPPPRLRGTSLVPPPCPRFRPTPPFPQPVRPLRRGRNHDSTPSRRRQIQLAALAGGSPRSSVSRVRALVTQTRGDPRP